MESGVEGLAAEATHPDRSSAPPPIPDRLNHLHVYEGRAVPFTVAVSKDGIPNYKVVDAYRRIDAIDHRLCAVCAHPLDYWIVFIGGPVSERTRNFRDPAMHEACARYALDACPFLRNPQREDDEAPTPIALFFTRKYETVMTDAGVVIKSAPFKRIEWLEADNEEGGEAYEKTTAVSTVGTSGRQDPAPNDQGDVEEQVASVEPGQNLSAPSPG